MNNIQTYEMFFGNFFRRPNRLRRFTSSIQNRNRNNGGKRTQSVQYNPDEDTTTIELPWEAAREFLTTTSPFDIREILREVTDDTGEPSYIEYQIISSYRGGAGCRLRVDKDKFLYLAPEQKYQIRGRKKKGSVPPIDGVDDGLTEEEKNFNSIKDTISSQIRYRKRTPDDGLFFYIRMHLPTGTYAKKENCEIAAGGIQEMCGFADYRVQDRYGKSDEWMDIELIFKF